jgi:hypothetical protein
MAYLVTLSDVASIASIIKCYKRVDTLLNFFIGVIMQLVDQKVQPHSVFPLIGELFILNARPLILPLVRKVAGVHCPIHRIATDPREGRVVSIQITALSRRSGVVKTTPEKFRLRREEVGNATEPRPDATSFRCIDVGK